MRVILKREVAGLGRPGDVKDVADGYAQNFLLPRGLAIEATAGELKVLARARDAKRAKRDRAHADAEELAKRLSETTLVFRLKAGEQGKTFGSDEQGHRRRAPARAQGRGRQDEGALAGTAQVSRCAPAP